MLKYLSDKNLGASNICIIGNILDTHGDKRAIHSKPSNLFLYDKIFTSLSKSGYYIASFYKERINNSPSIDVLYFAYGF